MKNEMNRRHLTMRSFFEGHSVALFRRVRDSGDLSMERTTDMHQVEPATERSIEIVTQLAWTLDLSRNSLGLSREAFARSRYPLQSLSIESITYATDNPNFFISKELKDVDFE